MDTTQEVNIVVIGCGWWAQGWHLPHLSQNAAKGVNIVALVDAVPQPKSNLNPNLKSMKELAIQYSCPTFTSVSSLLEDKVILEKMDGAIVCTPHSTHYEIGCQLLDRKKKLHIFMEKPMTTDLEDAQKLFELVTNNEKTQTCPPAFFVNNTANFRPQAQMTRSLLSPSQNAIGDIKHVTASFVSPLSWLFEDPSNVGWNKPSKNMLGNGFAWGQSSHILAWIFHTTNLIPKKVFCVMTHSEASGADVSHSATIICHRNGNSSNDETEDIVTFNLTGTTLLPGNPHSEPAIGKLINIQIYGNNGAILYSGDDSMPKSGSLELRRRDVNDGEVEYLLKEEGFLFENFDPCGYGPESLEEFIKACRGDEYYVGADIVVGLKTVQTLDAMYKSHHSGNVEIIV